MVQILNAVMVVVVPVMLKLEKGPLTVTAMVVPGKT